MIRCGLIQALPNKTSVPSPNTLAVCVHVTMLPKTIACRTVPREPTRYAATSVLPWPGCNACNAPNSNAVSSVPSTTPNELSPARNRASNDSPLADVGPGLATDDGSATPLSALKTVGHTSGKWLSLNVMTLASRTTMPARPRVLLQSAALMSW